MLVSFRSEPCAQCVARVHVECPDLVDHEAAEDGRRLADIGAQLTIGRDHEVAEHGRGRACVARRQPRHRRAATKRSRRHVLHQRRRALCKDNERLDKDQSSVLVRSRGFTAGVKGGSAPPPSALIARTEKRYDRPLSRLGTSTGEVAAEPYSEASSGEVTM